MEVLGCLFSVIGALVCVWFLIKAMMICACFARRAIFPKVDFKQYGTWAVITGSTDGIGKCYALQLAEKGLNVVLISRTSQKLASTASEIESTHGVKVMTVVADFKRTDIYENIRKQLQDLDIGVLVNNVGMVHPLTPEFYFNPTDYEQSSLDCINVNITSCVMMTNIVVPGMLGRGRGLVINISSMAGNLPWVCAGVYGPTKAFVTSYSQQLQAEYGSRGLTFQVVTPGYVRTSMMTDHMCRMSDVQPGLLFPTDSHFVASALRTAGKESETAGVWPHDLVKMFVKAMPGWLLAKMTLNKYTQNGLRYTHTWGSKKEN